MNQQASTFINSAINSNDGYNKAQIYPKIRLTYQDFSTKEISFEYQNQQETSTNIVFSVYVDKLIQYAEIMSNDQTRIYQTIDLSGLELNKYYVVSQKLEVV